MKKDDSKAFVAYEKPQISHLTFCVEQGFSASITLDDMYETEGSWE